MKPALALVLAALLLSGCSSALFSPKGSLIGSIVVYYAKDGLAWEVEDRNIGEDLYRLTVKQSKLKTTGQGEARLYFNRRAEEIASIQKCKGYTVLEYNESLISDYLNVPQRVTEGVIRCERSAKH